MQLRPHFVITIIIVLHGLIFSQAHWEYINDNPPRVKVYSSCLIENTAYFWGENNSVYKTSDGGETFTILPPYTKLDNTGLGCCDRHGIAFADSNTGYITDIGHGQFRTTNGGLSWQQVGNRGSNISLVDFGSEKVGYKVGGGGLHKTTDAGNTWTSYSTALLFNGGIFSNIFCLDAVNVWILKSYYSGRNSEGAIFNSRSGGVTWNKLETGLVSSDTNQVEYFDIEIKNSGNGLAIGHVTRPLINESKSFIQRTETFSDTWTTLELPNYNLKDILSIDDSTWIVVGNTSTSYYYQENRIVQFKSTDRGKTWNESRAISTDDYNLLYSSVYIPAFETILVNTLKGVFKSVDFGETYIRISTDLDIYVTDINSDKNSNNQILIASSFNRDYIISTDGGTSWMKKELPAELGYEIWETKIADGVIYIIVDQRKLFKSVDYGDSWTAITLPFYSSGIRGMDLLDKNTIALHSYLGVNTSQDGGITWTSAPFPDRCSIKESNMINSNEIVAVGAIYGYENEGIIYKTSDRGFSWRIEDVPDVMEQLKMVNDNIGFAMGDYSLYKTTDSGDSWKIIRSSNDFYQHFTSFAFSDTLNGFLFEGDGFRKTESGGKGWSVIDIWYPQRSADKLVYDGNQNLLAVGGGNLMRYSPTNGHNNNAINNEDEVSPNQNFILFQNSPNPFNPATNISFTIHKPGLTKLSVYNLLGELVNEFVNDFLDEGDYQYNFDASSLPSGIYFYALVVNGNMAVKKMNFVK